MYRYITTARNTRDTWATAMYIYIVPSDNFYVISPTFPFRSSSGGNNVILDTLLNDIDMAQKIPPEDITNGLTKYWNQDWKFTIPPPKVCN